MGKYLPAEPTVRAPDGSDLTSIASMTAPDISTPEKLALVAYTVWRAMVQRAGLHSDFFRRQPPEAMNYADAPGYRWRGSVNRVTDEMWGWYDTPSDEISRVKRELNRYLKLSGNLVCVVQGNATLPSTWFVRADYNDLPPYGVPGKAPEPRQEQKLTPAELGADRAPAPVETEFLCTWVLDDGTVCGHRAGNQTWVNRHIYAEHRTAEDWLMTALAAIGTRASAGEIGERAAEDGYPGTPMHTFSVLRALAEQGRVYGTQNNGSGAWEFWPVADPPPPEEEEDSAEAHCREPGCDAAPFEQAHARNRHEEAAHPGSLNREWGCEVCGARWFYSPTSLARHLNRNHGLRTTDAQYQAAMAAAHHPDRARREEKPADDWVPPGPVPARAVPPQKLANGASAQEVLEYLSAAFGGGEDVAALKARIAELEAENQELAARLRRIRLAAGGAHG